MSLEPPVNHKSLHRERLDAVVELKKQNDALKLTLETFSDRIDKIARRCEQYENCFAIADAKISKFSSDLVAVKDDIFDSIETYVSAETPRDSGLSSNIAELMKRIDALESVVKDKEKEKKLFRVKA
jgi:prefoldin subunit 5